MPVLTFDHPIYNILVCFPDKALSIQYINFLIDGLTYNNTGFK